MPLKLRRQDPFHSLLFPNQFLFAISLSLRDLSAQERVPPSLRKQRAFPSPFPIIQQDFPIGRIVRLVPDLQGEQKRVLPENLTGFCCHALEILKDPLHKGVSRLPR